MAMVGFLEHNNKYKINKNIVPWAMDTVKNKQMTRNNFIFLIFLHKHKLEVVSFIIFAIDKKYSGTDRRYQHLYSSRQCCTPKKNTTTHIWIHIEKKQQRINNQVVRNLRVNI